MTLVVALVVVLFRICIDLMVAKLGLPRLDSDNFQRLGFLIDDGVVLQVMLESLYILGETSSFKYFCLTVLRSRDLTIIGACQ